MDATTHIQELLGKSYEGSDDLSACWEFCIEMGLLFGFSYPKHPVLGMQRCKESAVGKVVLFKFGDKWHSGIVWPDGLHFIHAKSTNRRGTKHVVKQERLTAWPWTTHIEGYYEPCQA